MPNHYQSELSWYEEKEQEVEHHPMQLISSQASMTIVCTGVNDVVWIAQLSWRDYVNQMNDASMLAFNSGCLKNKAG